MKSKLAICYRVYPGISKIPAIFSDNKLKLTEFALASFVRAINFSNLKVKIWVILDNCDINYINLFENYLKDFEYELIDIPKSGNAATFGMQMNILSNQNFSEYIYFAEDDYFYLPDSLLEIIKILEHNLAEFVTPYEHPDLYNLKFHNYKKKKLKFDFSNYTWLESASTTMTFMTTKTYLKKYWNNFKSYTHKNFDASLWLSITKYNVRNPIKILSHILDNLQYLQIYTKLFYFSPFAFLGKKARLLCPAPSLATHLDNKGLPESVNWNKEFEELISGLQNIR